MSYDVELQNPDGTPVRVSRHEEGGTYALGGTEDAALNITYNYSPIYYEHGFSIRELDGKAARDTIETLVHVVDELGTWRDDDYWAPTKGNAGYAANILLKWAKDNPDAVWSVS